MLAIDDRKLYAAVGERIRDLRLQRSPKMTQAELANLLNVQRTSLTNIEQGLQRPPLAMLYKISHALAIDLASLLPSMESVLIPAEKIVAAGEHARVSVPEKTASLLRRLESEKHE